MGLPTGPPLPGTPPSEDELQRLRENPPTPDDVIIEAPPETARGFRAAIEQGLTILSASRGLPPIGFQGASSDDVPGWIDLLASIISYAFVFYLAAVAVHWPGTDNWIIALGLTALIVVFGGFIITPLRAVVRQLLVWIYLTLKDVVEFVFTWIRQAVEHFQGNILRMIIRIVVMAAFMWIWDLAQSIPAIAQLLDTILTTSRNILSFVNDLFDRALGFIENLPQQLLGWVDRLTENLGELGRGLRQEFTLAINQLFGRLTQDLQALRFRLDSQIDLLHRFLNLQLTIFGIRIRLIPEEVRNYLLAHYLTNPTADEQQTYDGLASLGAIGGPAPPGDSAPWHLIPYAQAQIAGIATGIIPLGESFRQIAVRDVAAFLDGTPPDVPDWPAMTLPPFEGGGGDGGGGGIPPDFIPAEDWQLVVSSCGGAGHVAYLVAAIGWHETEWGRLGAGRDGYILGVGVFDTGPDPTYQGLPAQLAWACPRLAASFPSPAFQLSDVLRFAQLVWRPGNPSAWAASVYAIFQGLWGARQG